MWYQHEMSELARIEHIFRGPSQNARFESVRKLQNDRDSSVRVEVSKEVMPERV